MLADRSAPISTRIFLATLLLLVLISPAHALLPDATGEGRKLPSLAPMLEDISPAVVNIATYAQVRNRNPLLQDPFFRRFFDLPENYGRGTPQRRTTSAGSGVIVDAKNGYVVTNAHVIRSADEVEVTLKDGRTLKASLVGQDEEVDLAVLKVEADNLTEIQVADSRGLRVGDFVVAIGNPFGLGQTVTSGIVSALGRTGLGIEGYENFIQTDASINPGNSGGALVNLDGKLVGVNTAIISPAGGNVGIGFAIPTEMVVNVMNQLIEHGEVHRGVLGVTVQDLTPELAEAFAVKRRQGVVITRVVEGSAADKAGIKSGDVVVAVDGHPVRRAADLRNKVGLSPVGERMEMTFYRDGRKRTVTAEISDAGGAGASDGGSISRHLKGAHLRTLAEGEKSGVSAGVLVEDVERGSPAWRAGLRPDDVIITANRQGVTGVEDLSGAVKDKDGALLLRVHRNGGVFFLVVR